jgi:Short C-terminal domain
MRDEASDEDRVEGAMWREFGLRNALANMPADSPGRAVVEALLARDTKAGKTQAPANEGDLPAQLERLAALRERGQLTQEEFEAAKRKLLA